MGKNKLRKFSDLEQMPHMVLQWPYGRLRGAGGLFALRGRWAKEHFGNANPVVVELGCGKGEYAVELARRFPGVNFIGVDIKGARLWAGARRAQQLGLQNVAFLRTSIELLEHFFAPGEVAQIWLTFPDPQMKKASRRLTSPSFLAMYSRLSAPGALLRLKTDSPFLYQYTRRVALANRLPLRHDTADLYALPPQEPLPEGLREIRTFYEQQWLSRGMAIKYLEMMLPGPWRSGTLVSPPDDDIPRDGYRSFSHRCADMNALDVNNPTTSE